SGAVNRIGSYVNESGIPRWHVDMKNDTSSTYWMNVPKSEEYPEGLRYYDDGRTSNWLKDILGNKR
ncbi:MAG: hypothetical protein OEZ43_21895, partial [Gammaproteobacteria bacterium]|nr:hypothetical protein [Gammaproteobacteria bacterium]